MTHISLPTVVDKQCTLLILGTMPGVQSLRDNEYYAHQDNVFWDILYRVFLEDWPMFRLVDDIYENKKKLLLKNKIALWDVLKICDRSGNLDKDICNEELNKLPDFFLNYPDIKTIVFNGHKAHNYFLKAFPDFLAIKKSYIFQSTSPSNQTNTFKILNEWNQLNQLVNP